MKKKTSPKKTPEKTGNDWLMEILSESHGTGIPDVVPPGWMTISDMARAGGVARNTMLARANNLLNKQIIQKKKFRISVGRNVVSVWHYNKA
jgi:hypothetical protein